MKRTRVKICGITSAEQARTCVSLGVDAIGINMYANSPRCISIEQAQQIRKAVPAFVSLVAVVVNDSARKINHYIDQIGVDLVQLHGDEDPEIVMQLNRPAIKAIRAKDKKYVDATIKQWSASAAILIDAYVQGQAGGTGQTIDQSYWPDDCKRPLILAGGLHARNIKTAIEYFAPYAVDLNSGIENAPGDKSTEKLLQTLTNIRSIESGASRCQAL